MYMYSMTRTPPKQTNNSVGNSLGPSVSLQVTWPGIDDAGEQHTFLQECFFVRILAFEYVGSMIPAYAWYISCLIQACICVQACSWHFPKRPQPPNRRYTPCCRIL